MTDELPASQAGLSTIPQAKPPNWPFRPEAPGKFPNGETSAEPATASLYFEHPMHNMHACHRALLGGKPCGVDVKFGDAPGMTESMHSPWRT
jgi:hypothetical protein